MILPDEEVIIEADKDALTKILTNLLDNGTKYAEFKLESGLEKDEVSNNIIFYTKNDGPLIDEENKDRIFEPFVRMETAQSSSGAGLGLSLCRRLAELHQGSLYIDTKLQGFNKFILTLPITQKAIQNQI
jgi:signal transduction histidine kinase